MASQQEIIGAHWVSAAILALAVAFGEARARGSLTFLPAPQPPATSKPFSTFNEFYPFYLQEHSDIMTKRMHYVGTFCFIVLMALSKGRLVLPIAAAGAVGFAAFPLLRHLTSGIPEMALMVGTYLIGGYAATGSWRTVLLPMVLAYGFAWVGHYGFEGNRPATFIYPTFSLLGDFRMFAEMVMGKQPR